MRHTLKMFCCLLLMTVHISAQALLTVPCEVNDPDKCSLNGLFVERGKFPIPLADNSSAIRRISITNSTIPVIDETLCKAFPNVMEIDVNNNSVKEIQANALTECKELKMLEMDGNQVTELPSGMFATSDKLESFSICENQLTKIDPELFQGAVKLTKLYLGSNSIKTLDPEVFKHVKELQKLDVYNNELADLELKKIFGYATKLNTINLRFNSFKCGRLREILNFLNEKKVDLEKVDWIGDKKRVKYNPEWIDDIECDNGGKPLFVPTTPAPKKGVSTKASKKEKKGSGAMNVGVQMSLIVFCAVLGRLIF